MKKKLRWLDAISTIAFALAIVPGWMMAQNGIVTVNGPSPLAPTNSTPYVVTSLMDIVSPRSIAPTPITFSQANDVSFYAGNSITLGPGFRADYRTGTGKFLARIQGWPSTVEDIAWITTGAFERFHKIELGVRLSPALETQVDDFIAAYPTAPMTTTGINPFDENEIDIWAEFVPPSGGSSVRRTGFYYEDMVRIQNPTYGRYVGWEAQPTYHRFRIRFAPDQQGTWTFRIGVKVNGGAPEYSQFGSFNVFNTLNHPGFVERVPGDHYLQRSTGAAYNPMGVVMGPYTYQPYLDQDPCNVWPPRVREMAYDFYDQCTTYINGVSDNGASFVRIQTSPWTNDPEWEYLGNYHNRMNICWETDRVLEYASAHGVGIEWGAIFTQYGFNRDYASGRHGTYSWYEDPIQYTDVSNYVYPGTNPMDLIESFRGKHYTANPYNKYLFNQTWPTYNPELFLTDPTAKAYAKRKLRYIAARWGYSADLVNYDLFTEIDMMMDNGDGDRDEELVWRNAHGTDIANWSIEMAAYLKSQDPKHLVVSGIVRGISDVTSTIEPWANAIWADANIDIVNLHHYNPEEYRNHMRAYWSTELSAMYGKPVKIGEMGLTAECLTDEAGIHSNIWSTALGGSLTGVEYWSERINMWQWWPQWKPLAVFLQSENLTGPSGERYKPMRTVNYVDSYCGAPFTSPDIVTWSSGTLCPNGYPNGATRERLYVTAPTSADEKDTEVFALRKEDNSRILGWIHNRRYDWMNAPSTGTSPITPVCPHPDHENCSGDVAPHAIGPCDNVPSPMVRFENMGFSKDYHVEIWSTTGAGNMINSFILTSDWLGRLDVYFGVLGCTATTADDAFKIYPVSSRESRPVVDVPLPLGASLGNNFPNPFDASTTIPFEIPQAGEVTLTIHDVQMRPVTVLLDHESTDAGSHQASFDGSKLIPGVYFYTLEYNDQKFTKRMVILH